MSINIKSRSQELERKLQEIYEKRDVGTLTTDTCKMFLKAQALKSVVLYFLKYMCYMNLANRICLIEVPNSGRICLFLNTTTI